MDQPASAAVRAPDAAYEAILIQDDDLPHVTRAIHPLLVSAKEPLYVAASRLLAPPDCIDNMKCIICACVADAPVSFVDCPPSESQHTMCAGCAKKLPLESFRCPVCRTHGEIKRLDETARMIATLRVSCREAAHCCTDKRHRLPTDNGDANAPCREEARLHCRVPNYTLGMNMAAERAHLAVCAFHLVPCVGCQSFFRRCDLEVHRTTECAGRIVECGACHAKMTTAEYAEHTTSGDEAVNARCTNVQACPNRCMTDDDQTALVKRETANRFLVKSDLEAHLEVCPLRRVECEACHKRVPINQMGEHAASHVGTQEARDELREMLEVNLSHMKKERRRLEKAQATLVRPIIVTRPSNEYRRPVDFLILEDPAVIQSGNWVYNTTNKAQHKGDPPRDLDGVNIKIAMETGGVSGEHRPKSTAVFKTTFTISPAEGRGTPRVAHYAVAISLLRKWRKGDSNSDDMSGFNLDSAETQVYTEFTMTTSSASHRLPDIPFSFVYPTPKRLVVTERDDDGNAMRRDIAFRVSVWSKTRAPPIHARRQAAPAAASAAAAASHSAGDDDDEQGDADMDDADMDDA